MHRVRDRTSRGSEARQDADQDRGSKQARALARPLPGPKLAATAWIDWRRERRPGVARGVTG